MTECGVGVGARYRGVKNTLHVLQKIPPKTREMKMSREDKFDSLYLLEINSFLFSHYLGDCFSCSKTWKNFTKIGKIFLLHVFFFNLQTVSYYNLVSQKSESTKKNIYNYIIFIWTYQKHFFFSGLVRKFRSTSSTHLTSHSLFFKSLGLRVSGN